jgi:hypothetical protein
LLLEKKIHEADNGNTHFYNVIYTRRSTLRERKHSLCTGKFLFLLQQSGIVYSSILHFAVLRFDMHKTFVRFRKVQVEHPKEVFGPQISGKLPLGKIRVSFTRTSRV